MAARDTNLALAGLTLLAVSTGFVSFGLGTPPGGWAVVIHGVLGIGIVVLAPWKSAIARRGMRRGERGRSVSVFLTVATVIAVVSGVIQVTGTTDRLGQFTTMQVHVGAGLATLAAMVVHWLQRPVRPRPTDASRRNALRATGLLGAGGALWLGTEGVLHATGASGADRRFTGSHDIGPSARVPPTQWLNDTIQRIDAESHTVRVPGGRLGVSEIDSFGDEVEAVLDCTGGWHAQRTWSGMRLDRLFGQTDAASLVVRSATGYWRRFPVEHASRMWLATRLEGEPLPAGNGAPVRLVAPGRRGYWWVKWVDRVDTDDLPSWWQPPLPTA